MKITKQAALDAMAKRRQISPINHLTADIESLLANGLLFTTHQIVENFALNGQITACNNVAAPLWVEAIKILLLKTDIYYSVNKGDSLFPKHLKPNAQAFINHCRLLGNLLQQRDDYPTLVAKFLVEIRATGVIVDGFTGDDLVADLVYCYKARNGNVERIHYQYNTVNPQTMYA